MILYIFVIMHALFSDKGEPGVELFPVYIVQQVHPWLPDSEAKLARQDGAHLWLRIQNWREMLQCLNVVSVCDASSTLWCLRAFYVCDIFIYYFPKTLTNIFLISTCKLCELAQNSLYLLFFYIDYYTVHFICLLLLNCSTQGVNDTLNKILMLFLLCL